MERISQQFLGLHNLNSLAHLERKIQCYSQFAAHPHEYYECFLQVEDRRNADANELTGAYNLIEEEFKLCNEGCKNVGTEGTACTNTCTDRFTNSVQGLYDAFYKTRVGGRKEYKKARN